METPLTALQDDAWLLLLGHREDWLYMPPTQRSSEPLAAAGQTLGPGSIPSQCQARIGLC